MLSTVKYTTFPSSLPSASYTPLSMANRSPPKRSSSLSFLEYLNSNMDRSKSTSVKDFALKPEKNMGFNSRRSSVTPELGSTARDMGVKRFDGSVRTSAQWDGLRRDPELWYPEGNCYVHLYGRGQSRRGPAFRLPMEDLHATQCQPLLDRFLVRNLSESPISEVSSSDDGYYFGQQSSGKFELYIPAPPTAERGQAFLYHSATRNFFAWVFGKPLVGSHLGGALVGLLNSMDEFRTNGEDNIQAIIDYMDEEGYADMRNSPDHALAILFFAEHFQFKDMWIDAFAHCTGMHEKLATSPGFEYISRTSRALITRSRFEMDMRLELAGEMLGSFLWEELSDAHFGISVAARSHLDRFRSFLQQYYVAKLGYYPPRSVDGTGKAFPKNIYGQMCQEFQKLYDYLVDFDYTSADLSRPSQQGGICVLQNIQAFDSRHKYTSLPNPLPRLPEGEDIVPTKPTLSKRLSWYSRSDKMKPDPRLTTFSSLSKATNRTDPSLHDCSLVRAYKGFEKDCIFSPTRGDKSDRISQTDARKVRWILIYGILQTLLSVTDIPEQVRDTQNVPYNLCVLTAGCPPWKDITPYRTLLRSQTEQTKEDFLDAQETQVTAEATVETPFEIKPDVDYLAITHRAEQEDQERPRAVSMYGMGSIGASMSRKGTVRRALSTLGNMPELRHPSPKRPVYHEILVHGYGNGTNTVSITAGEPPSPPTEQEDPLQSHQRKESAYTISSEDISSRWSNSSMADSPRSSYSHSSRTGSGEGSVLDFLDRPMSTISEPARPSSAYSVSIYDDALEPEPLQLRKDPIDDMVMTVTTTVKVEYEDKIEDDVTVNKELSAYLGA